MLKKFTILLFLLCISFFGSVAYSQNYCGVNTENQGLFVYNGDANRPNPSYGATTLSSNLSGYYTVGNILVNNSTSSGYWFHTSANVGQPGYLASYNGNNKISVKDATVFRLQNVTGSYTASNALTYRITLSNTSPGFVINQFTIGSLMTVFNNDSPDLNFWVMAYLYSSTGSQLAQLTAGDYINAQLKYVSTTSNYVLRPGNTYEIRFAVANVNNKTDAFIDNPGMYAVPVPVTTSNSYVICNTTTSVSALNSLLKSPVSITTPQASTVRWFNGSTYVTGNLSPNTTYTPYYYNNATGCYYPAGDAVSVSMGGVPVVSTQPANISICDPGNASFSASFSNNPVSYQWQVSTDNGANYNNINDGGVYSNTQSANLLITGATVAMNNYRYRVIATNSCGNATSNARVLTVSSNPAITNQPSNVSICEGLNTSFTITATNANSYQWQVSTNGGSSYNNISNGSLYSNVTTSNLNITGVNVTMDTYRYRVQVTGTCGTSFSNGAVLNVTKKPGVQSNAVNQSVCSGQSTSFAASITNATSYQWQVSTDGGSNYVNISNNSIYSGATTNTLALTAVPASYNGYYYKLIAGNTCGTVETSARLIVNGSTKITTQPSPSSEQLNVNQSPSSISVVATGATSYQWYKNNVNSTVGGVAIAGATSSSYTPVTSSVPTTDYYYVVVTGLCNNETSMVASKTYVDGVCVKPGNNMDSPLASSLGILTKSNISVEDWPAVVPNGYIVLDSANKGLVITQMTTSQIFQLVPVKGMLVYDLDAKCVKLYRGEGTNAPSVDPSRSGWVCIKKGCNN